MEKQQGDDEEEGQIDVEIIESNAIEIKGL
jgi:hypothetical protein